MNQYFFWKRSLEKMFLFIRISLYGIAGYAEHWTPLCVSAVIKTEDPMSDSARCSITHTEYRTVFAFPSHDTVTIVEFLPDFIWNNLLPGSWLWQICSRLPVELHSTWNVSHHMTDHSIAVHIRWFCNFSSFSLAANDE